MRIISPFKDYYDCMQSYYQDDLIYIRNKIEVKNTELINYYDNYITPPYYSRLHNNRLTVGWQHKQYRIGFCGKIYNCVQIIKPEDKIYNYLNKPKPILCFSNEDLERYYPKEARELIDYFKNTKWITISSQNMILQTFIKYKSPIFVKYKEVTVYNECLKDFSFQRIFNPQMAYQELMMFFGSVLTQNEKKIPHIDDKIMVEAKGFNKYSFRKDKHA